MKLLVLTSRYTATRDIIDEDFGRQVRLFSALQKRGHDVTFFVADYRKKERRDTVLHGMKVKIRPFSIFSFFPFFFELNRLLQKKAFDVFVASGDPLWGIVGYWANRKAKLRFIYDLHDNYETYAMYRVPFFKYLDRFAMRSADAIIAVTNQLKRKIQTVRKKDVIVIENGVDRSVFRPLDRTTCRNALKLPLDKKIIAFTGSICLIEGVDRLIDAFKTIQSKRDDCMLLIAGRFVKGEEKYINLKQQGIVFVGSLPQKKIAVVINAADVAVIPYTANEQTIFGFPYKLFEYMACQTPVVATAVGDIPAILKNRANHLCNPDSIQSMAQTIEKHLKSDKVNFSNELRQYTWKALAEKMETPIGARSLKKSP